MPSSVHTYLTFLKKTWLSVILTVFCIIYVASPLHEESKTKYEKDHTYYSKRSDIFLKVGYWLIPTHVSAITLPVLMFITSYFNGSHSVVESLLVTIMGMIVTRNLLFPSVPPPTLDRLECYRNNYRKFDKKTTLKQLEREWEATGRDSNESMECVTHDPNAPTTLENLRCYINRYTDLKEAYCPSAECTDAQLNGEVKTHWVEHGSTEREQRRLECPDSYNYRKPPDVMWESTICLALYTAIRVYAGALNRNFEHYKNINAVSMLLTAVGGIVLLIVGSESSGYEAIIGWAMVTAALRSITVDHVNMMLPFKLQTWQNF